MSTDAMEALPDRVVCQVCFRDFKVITNTHLQRHGMTVAEYKTKFPDSPVVSRSIAEARGTSLGGKTYVEVYGEEGACELKEERSRAAIRQFEDPEQRRLRSERLSGREVSQETRDKLSRARTKHGFEDYRERALEYFGPICMRCRQEMPEDRLVVHHEDDSGALGGWGDHSLENLKVLCRPCHTFIHNEKRRFQDQWYAELHLSRAAAEILKALEIDSEDANFRETPARMARMWKEFTWGLRSREELEGILSKTFPAGDLDQMIIARTISAVGLCPHHLLPARFTIDVGYIPKRGGQVLGLSKIARAVDLLSHRPVLQEQLTQDIAQSFMDALDPEGVGVLVRGLHSCMLLRGIRMEHSEVITSVVLGNFRDAEVKSEFLKLIGD